MINWKAENNASLYHHNLVDAFAYKKKKNHLQQAFCKRVIEF